MRVRAAPGHVPALVAPPRRFDPLSRFDPSSPPTVRRRPADSRRKGSVTCVARSRPTAAKGQLRLPVTVLSCTGEGCCGALRTIQQGNFCNRPPGVQRARNLAYLHVTRRAPQEAAGAGAQRSLQGQPAPRRLAPSLKVPGSSRSRAVCAVLPRRKFTLWRLECVGSMTGVPRPRSPRRGGPGASRKGSAARRRGQAAAKASMGRGVWQ
jgi:hypothetical protein